MLITKKNILKLSKPEYQCLKFLSHKSKDLYNVTLYNTRQHFFKTEKYLNYIKNYEVIKTHVDYNLLPSDVAQQTMKIVEQGFKSFFALLKLKNEGKYDEPVFIPGYLEKSGFFILQFPIRKNQSQEYFFLRFSKQLQEKYGINNIKVNKPEIIKDKNLKQVRIIPKCNAKYFEIEWIYEEERIEKHAVDKDRTISIDPGVSNFATILDNKSGDPIILDGKKIKSYNRFFNKKSKQKENGSMNKKRMFYKRSRILNDAINQYVNLILQYCIINKVGNVVMGEGYLAQKNTKMGNVNNQNFVNIPYGKFIQKLSNKCELYGISFSKQEESYTSKCDHLSGETMQHHDEYIGKRTTRGSFKSSTGILLNSDVNGALGILIKSKHEIDLGQLMSSGRLTRPRRIKLEDIQKNSSIRLVNQLQHF